jgi:uncharacterized RDD family membrane protein YckC
VAEPVVLDSTAEVETPEHVRFRYRLAGPTRRGLAYLIDLLIRAAVLTVLVIAVQLSVGGLDEEGLASKGVVLVLLFAMEWGYYVVFESIWSGRTPGKRALSLRVMKEGGYPLGFVDSVLRNLLRAADFLPFVYATGLLSMALDRRFRRLGDLVAGTMVVLEERAAAPPPLTLQPPATADELQLVPQRPRLDAWEQETLELLLRRTDLGPARRQELAEMIAPALGRRLGVPVADPLRFVALVHHRVQASARPVATVGASGVARS